MPPADRAPQPQALVAFAINLDDDEVAGYDRAALTEAIALDLRSFVSQWGDPGPIQVELTGLPEVATEPPPEESDRAPLEPSTRGAQ